MFVDSQGQSCAEEQRAILFMLWLSLHSMIGRAIPTLNLPDNPGATMASAMPF